MRINESPEDRVKAWTTIVESNRADLERDLQRGKPDTVVDALRRLLAFHEGKLEEAIQYARDRAQQKLF